MQMGDGWLFHFYISAIKCRMLSNYIGFEVVYNCLFNFPRVVVKVSIPCHYHSTEAVVVTGTMFAMKIYSHTDCLTLPVVIVD